jgi:hypothetical protein
MAVARQKSSFRIIQYIRYSNENFCIAFSTRCISSALRWNNDQRPKRGEEIQEASSRQ